MTYWLNIKTGETLDGRKDYVTDFRRRTPNWGDVIVEIPEKVYNMFNYTKLNSYIESYGISGTTFLLQKLLHITEAEGYDYSKETVKELIEMSDELEKAFEQYDKNRFKKPDDF